MANGPAPERVLPERHRGDRVGYRLDRGNARSRGVRHCSDRRAPMVAMKSAQVVTIVTGAGGRGFGAGRGAG